MNDDVHDGSCHCGELRLEFATARPLASFSPRACDCAFCKRHRAAWISDHAGHLRILATGASLQRYRQGSGQADFLLCRTCGVLVAVVASMADGMLRGAANRNAFDERDAFTDETIVSPQRLAADAKLARWDELWTPVELRIG